jgi:hypothetical protein
MRTTVEWEGAFEVSVHKSNHKPPLFKAFYSDLNVFAQMTGHYYGKGKTAEEAVVDLFKEHPREKISALLEAR